VNITKSLTVDHIHGDLDGAVLKQCKNTDSVTLRKGDPVFISGNVGVSDVIEIQLARADTIAKMPAVGLCAQPLDVNATGYVVVVGILSNTDTSEFTVGNSVYVNSTGWVTNVRPTGASILVQNLGKVARSNVNNGQIIVLGPGRTNNVSNSILASGTITLGTPDIITPLVGTASVFNTNVARLNIGSSASGVLIGNATGVVTVGDIAVNNGAITTTSSTGSVFNTNIRTVNAFTSATLVNIATGNIFDPAEKVIKIGTTAGGDGGVIISIGSSSAGTTTINSPSTVFGGDVVVNGGDITTSNSLATIFNTTAARVNIGGGASGVQIGHPTGTVVMGNISATGYVSAASGYRVTSAAINAQTATGYTLVSTDNGKIITFDGAATHTLRIPTSLDIGFNATIIQLGTGQVTCTGLAGVTLNCYASGNKILGQHGSASVLCYASNVYNLAGTLGI